jgi:hypothetical protein
MNEIGDNLWVGNAYAVGLAGERILIVLQNHLHGWNL